MTKKYKKRFLSRPQSFYDLSEVKDKIKSENVAINRNAELSAQQDFGWGHEEIFEVYLFLQPKHFYKKENSKIMPLVVIDYYKLRYKGENIYTHFYIDDTKKMLVINSFKQLIKES